MLISEWMGGLCDVKKTKSNMIRQASFPILLLIGPALAFAIKGFAPILALAGLTAILAMRVSRAQRQFVETFWSLAPR